MTSILQLVFAGAVMLGVLVFIHELGHFLVAKAAGVRVERFSIGFGKVLVGFRRGDTEYCLSAIPFGGYVKMFGEDLREEARIAPSERAASFSHKPLAWRFAIVFAGPGMNYVLAVALLFGLMVGEQSGLPARIGGVMPGGPAQTAGLLPGDVVRAIDGTPVPDWDSMRRQVAGAIGRPLRFEVERGGEPRTVTVTPRAAHREDELGAAKQQGLIGIVPFDVAAVVSVPDPASPAGAAGLRTFDRVEQVDGVDVATFDALEAALAPALAGRAVAVTVARDVPLELPGAEVGLVERLTFTLAPPDTLPEAPPPTLSAGEGPTRAARAAWVLGLEPATRVLRSVEPDTPAAAAGLRPGDAVLAVEGKAVDYWAEVDERLGAARGDTLRLTVRSGLTTREVELRQERRPLEGPYGHARDIWVFGGAPADWQVIPDAVKFQVGAWDAMRHATRRSIELCVLMVQGIVSVVRGEIDTDAIRGPITIVQAAGESAQQGLASYLFFMAAISLNLFLLNLFPVPVLDGGHLLFFALEAVMRRPVSRRVREHAMRAGLAALLLLMFFALKNDLVSALSL